MSFFFYFLSFFLKLRERERVHKIGYKEKLSQSLLIFFRWIPLLRANKLYAIFSTGVKKWLLRVRDIFCLLLPGILGFGSVRHEPCPTTNFFIIYFRWREGVPTFSALSPRFKLNVSPKQRWLSLPVSGDLREATEYKHLFLTVILWRLATVNSNTRIVVILFLSSQWDTTWQGKESQSVLLFTQT